MKKIESEKEKKTNFVFSSAFVTQRRSQLSRGPVVWGSVTPWGENIQLVYLSFTLSFLKVREWRIWRTRQNFGQILFSCLLVHGESAQIDKALLCFRNKAWKQIVKKIPFSTVQTLGSSPRPPAAQSRPHMPVVVQALTSALGPQLQIAVQLWIRGYRGGGWLGASVPQRRFSKSYIHQPK